MTRPPFLTEYEKYEAKWRREERFWRALAVIGIVFVVVGLFYTFAAVL